MSEEIKATEDNNTAITDADTAVAGSDSAVAGSDSAVADSDSAVADSDTAKIKRSGSILKPEKNDLCVLIYAAIYIVSLIYFEILLRTQISGSINSQNITFLFFIPAEGFFFAALTGFHKKSRLVNKIIGTLLLLVLGIYYIVQLIYFRIFGSIISVSMLGMGTDAVGQFGWAMKGTIIESIGFIILLLLPAILFAVFSFIKPLTKLTGNKISSGYTIWLHVVCLAFAVILWIAGIFGLKALGTGRQSAYSVMTNSMSDTDTTAERIGTLATTVVEGGSYYFHIRLSDSDTAVATVNNDALKLGSNSGNSGSGSQDGNSVSGSAAGSYAAGDGTESGSGNSTGSGDSSQESSSEPEITYEIKPHVNEAINFSELKSKTNDTAIQSLCDYFDSRECTNTNEYTGLFEGYNLIYICAESFNQYALDENVTPTLYKMAHGGIVLNNYYNAFKNTTTNGEFALATSNWPDVSRVADQGTAVGSFPQSATVYMPYGLGDFFDAIDVPTYAYHDFYGSYYKRKYSWPNLGYETIKFMGRGMSFTSAWPASDLEMFEQSVDDYIENDQFHAYYMTFSGHGPYTSANVMYQKNIDAVTELAAGKYTDDGCLGYLCGEYELDQAMNYLLTRLEDAGKLDNTVIVIGGDHFPYYMSQSSRTEFNGGQPLDEDFEQYHSCCIIYNAGLEEPIVSDTYCCNVDILPTILNLFGIDYDSRLLMGTDIFSDGIHRARLYNGSFITEYVKYNNATGETSWSDATSEFTDDQLSAYLDAMIDYTESEYSASLNVISNNFYLYVWENSGLLTADEVQTEKNRETQMIATYEQEAAAEAAKKAEEELEEQQAQQALDAQNQQAIMDDQNTQQTTTNDQGTQQTTTDNQETQQTTTDTQSTPDATQTAPDTTPSTNNDDQVTQ